MASSVFNVGHIRQLVVRGNSTGQQFLDDNMGAGISTFVDPAATISNIQVSVNESYWVTITWTTSTSQTSLVRYSTDTSYSSTEGSGFSETSHEVTLTGLTPNTTYNFKVGNLAGTTLSANQTFTSRRLELPRFGPFAAKAQAFEDAAPDYQAEGSVVFTSFASPGEYATFTAAEASTHNSAQDGFPDMYLRLDKLLIGFDGYIEAEGENGGIAEAGDTGAGGGRGHNGGGGGGGSSAGAGLAAGGVGGNTAAGADGSAGEFAGDGFPGDGGAGSNSADTYSYGADPGAGGDGGSAEDGGGGGGGAGSGGRVVICVNECSGIFGYASSSGISAPGGTGGGAIGNGEPGSNGADGTTHVFARKWAATELPTPLTELYEVSGSQTAGWVITGPVDQTIAFDHLYQP